MDDGTRLLSVPDRLPRLGAGRHRPGSPEPCAMEAAAWLAGESWTDHPRSVHPVIAAVARWANDTVSDSHRQRLWPLILASLDTARPRRPLFRLRLEWAALTARRHGGPDPRGVWEALLAARRSLLAPAGERCGAPPRDAPAPIR